MKKNKNKLYSVCRWALAGWMISFSLGAWAQSVEPVDSISAPVQEVTPVAVQDSAQQPKKEPRQVSSQFNALDYVLQSPAKNEKFASKKFGDHLFLTGEGGITMLRTPNYWFATPGVGLRAGVAVGDWFTPVHGARVGISGGWHNGEGGHNPYLIGVSADYLMNLSSLLRKDNPNRRFEFIGAAGLEYQLLYRRGDWFRAGGLRLGLQTRLNFSPLTFFYLEPRFGIYTDGIDAQKTWRHWDWEGALMAGFGYRWLSEPVRKNTPFVGHGRGFFVSGGAGLTSLWRSSMTLSTESGAAAMLAIGHQFTPVSSLRLSGFLHYFPQNPEKRKWDKSSFGLNLDYMFNLHSLFGGYDPTRRLEVSGVLGAGLHDVSLGPDQTVHWSVGGGVHANLNLNDNWALFLEPRLDIFPNTVWEDQLSMADPVPSVLAGFTYYPAPRALGHAVEGEDFDFHSPLGNVYVTLGGGFAGLMRSSLAQPFAGKGFRVAGGVGTQWNPVSGVRAMMTFTSINNESYTAHRTLGVGAQLDYMLYFSNLFWGYKTNRLFEVNGVLGLNYDYVSSDRFCHSIALGTGIQGVFNVGDMFEIFLEPRLQAGLNNRWEKGELTRIDVVPTFLAGVNYNLYGYSRKHNMSRANEPFSNDHFTDHMFVGVGVGTNAVLHHKYFSNLDRYIGPMGSIYIGKWFTPASGIRASLSGALYGDRRGGNRKLAIADISYLWNINSTLYGYRPSRIFETTLGVGASLAYATSQHTGFYPGLNVSLQGLWRVSPNMGIFVEPQLRFFNQKFSNDRYAYLPFDVHTALQVGVQYQLDGYDGATNRAIYEEDENNYFFSIGYTGRALKRSASKYTVGHGGSLSFGKWYTPLSAWRLGIDYGYYGEKPRYMSLSLSADYLFNLSAYMWQYNPRRAFDLLAVAGVTVGAGNSQQTNEFTYGFKAGLQGRFNITPKFDIFVEPQVLTTRVPKWDGVGFAPEARIVAGINYNMGRDNDRGNETLEKKNFFSVSGGLSMFSETILLGKTRRASGAFDISYGHWFNPTSGVQIGYGNDPISLGGDKSLKVNSLHADYLLNLTSLFDSNTERGFDMIGVVGAGIGWSNGNTAWLGEGRLQFRWNVSRTMSLYAEPSMTLWGDKLYRENTHNFIGVGRLSVGAAVRF